MIFLLLLAAAVCFGVATIATVARVNLVALGLFCLALSFLITTGTFNRLSG